MPAEQRESPYATTEVPRPACGRCEDWTTVVHRRNTISPCPSCRLDEYQEWLAVRSGEYR